MLLSAFEIKTFLSDYGYAFAATAAALFVILLIVIISTAVKISRLKRENKILAKQANRAGQLLATADRGPVAMNGAAEEPNQNSIKKVGAENTAAVSETAAASDAEPKENISDGKVKPQTAEKPNYKTSIDDNRSEQTVGKPAAEKNASKSASSPLKSPTAAVKSSTGSSGQNRRAAEEKDEVVMDENSRVKYTVKYDRAKMNWVIIKEGNERPTRRVATKSEAMSLARELSKKHDAALSVHKKDGKFQKQ